MKLAIAGGAVVDAAHFNESLLEIITRRLRQLIDTLKQPGRP
ncbi:MAG: protease FtsH-inhibitory lysogeny factor CIII [Mixta calida]|nr:protease FtsH-inhibitory lysogeny factor CIII [Mixta calida]